MSKCQKMSNCQKDVKIVRQLDYGGGSQKKIMMLILMSHVKVIKIGQKYFLSTI